MDPVYVVTVEYKGLNTRTVPEVFDSLPGAKQYVKENWGVKLQRLSPSHWQSDSDLTFTINMDKRTVFSR